MTPAKWTPARRAKMQHPNGRYDWQRLGYTIAVYRHQGWTLRQIADHTGINFGVIHRCSTKTRTLDRAQQGGLVRLTDLAPELGVTAANLVQRAQSLGITTTKYGRCHAIEERDVPTLTEYYRQRIDAHTARSWWTLKEVARALNLGEDAAMLRIHKARPPFDLIRRARVLGAPGNMWRYDPDSVRAVASARPVGLRTRPAGALSSAELVALLGVSRAVPKGWATQGAPHTRTIEGATGFLYFSPLPLADWLSQSRAPTRRSFARMLREYAAGQGRRAA